MIKSFCKQKKHPLKTNLPEQKNKKKTTNRIKNYI